MIIAFDGNVYCGKTTLINSIAKDHGFNKINEHSHYASEGGRDYLKTQKRFLKVDEKRIKCIKGEVTLLDRSLVSLSAHVWALYKQGKADIRAEFINELFSRMDRGKIIMPDLFINVACDYTVTQSRALKHRNSKGTANFLMEEDYFCYIAEFNKKISGRLQSIFIDSSCPINECKAIIIKSLAEGKTQTKDEIKESIKEAMK
ncbi:MAG: hypothetical protein ABIB71_05915 [Candidatus Woesearchaeota archaeon]